LEDNFDSFEQRQNEKGGRRKRSSHGDPVKKITNTYSLQQDGKGTQGMDSLAVGKAFTEESKNADNDKISG